jgi:hypothetical protein
MQQRLDRGGSHARRRNERQRAVVPAHVLCEGKLACKLLKNSAVGRLEGRCDAVDRSVEQNRTFEREVRPTLHDLPTLESVNDDA